MAARLDNVLKRAEELELMDKAPAALDILYETVSSKRARAMPLDQLEPLFEKFVQLAVGLRRGKVVKDGLHQYKKLVLQANGDAQGAASLVGAVEQLLRLGSEQVSNAQKQAREAKVEAEDLEQGSPQDLLLALVSSDDTADRADRDFVTPWLKFLWESYRGVLDVLRNNAKLESAYASCAGRALDFCAEFERKTEFRRLCELLRTHLQYAATQSRAYQKEYSAARQRAIEQADTADVTHEQVLRQMPPSNLAQSPIDLSDADTLQRFLDTRFKQLDVAVKLELWQEAFRSVEDVHSLLTASRRPVARESMATYYETLARVFAVSKNHLFHAATYLRYFAMLQARRAPESELQRVAALTVLGLLCVPRDSQSLAPSGRTRRWMGLISLSRCPTRASLIQAALQRNVLVHAPEEVRTLFNLLETEFNPLSFKSELSSVAPALQKAEFSIYAQPLLEVAATAVFDDLAATYAEAELEFVLNLVSFPAPLAAEPRELERLLVRGSAQQGFRVRIDHNRRIVRFVDSFAYPLEGTAGALVRTELYDFARDLSVLSTSSTAPIYSDEDVVRLRRSAFINENRVFLERKEREEERERRLHDEKLRSDEEAQRERVRIALEEKQRAEERAAAEEAARQEQQLKKQFAETELAEKRKLAESINAKGHVQVDLDKLESLSKDELNRMQIDQLDLEAKSLTARMAAVSRRYDHLERALRREEARIWTEDASKQQSRDEERHKRRTEALLQGAIRSHELDIAYSSRLGRVGSEFAAFQSVQKSRYDSRVASQRAKNAELLEAAKEKRKAEAIVKYREQKKLEEQRKLQEEENRKQEEERRKRQEKMEELKRKDEELRRNREEHSKNVYRPAHLAAAQGQARPTPVEGIPRATGSSSPFGAAAGKPPASVGVPRATGGSPFGAAAGKPPANVSIPRATGSSSPFGAAAGKPPANVGATAGRPSSSPFGAAAGKPPANVGAPKRDPFGAASGKPAATPGQPTPGKYVPPSKK